MKSDLESEIATAEESWPVPNIIPPEEPKETALAIRAHSYFSDKILLAAGIKARVASLGLTGEVTPENYNSAKTVTALCRKARGDIERNRKLANEDALAWQRAINGRAKELVAEIELIETPYKTGIKAIDDEKARIKQEAEDAERKAVEDAAWAKLEAERAADDAKRAAEAEANCIEAERLAKEREAFAAERRKIDQAAAIERARLAVEAVETAKILEESVRADSERLNAKLAQERAAFAEEQRIVNAQRLESDRLANAEAAERKRISDEFYAAEKAKRDALEAELAEHRAAKAAAEKAEQDRIAAKEANERRLKAAEAEAARLEAIKPDVEKVRALGTTLEEIVIPDCSSDEARATINRIVIDLQAIVLILKVFGSAT